MTYFIVDYSKDRERLPIKETDLAEEIIKTMKLAQDEGRHLVIYEGTVAIDLGA